MNAVLLDPAEQDLAEVFDHYEAARAGLGAEFLTSSAGRFTEFSYSRTGGRPWTPFTDAVGYTDSPMA